MIFAIFKVIGYILLTIIALFIALILLVLFWPIRYSANGKFDRNDISVKADVSWLFHIVAAGFGYSDDISAWYRILFWKKNIFDENEEDWDTAADSEKKYDDKENCDEDAALDEADMVFHIENKVESENDSIPAGTENEAVQNREHIKRKKHKNKRTADIKDKLSSKKKIFYKIKSMLSDKADKAAVKHLKEEGFLILKRVCPKKLKLNLEFSTGEPDTTGIALGIIAMFPVCYKNKWNIKCDFESEEAYAAGVFDISGHIFVISVLGAVIRIMLDKNCRRLYNKITK